MIKKNCKFSIFLLLSFCISLFLFGCDIPDEDKLVDGEPGTLETPHTDVSLLQTNYQSKQFLTEGIGKVTLLRVIDGDTMHFLDSNKNTIKIRLIGINTPESTGTIAPWGKRASTFAKNKLKDDTDIIIEANEIGKTPDVDSTGSRYLGYVWYRNNANEEYRLFNMETIEQGFSYFTGTTSTEKYGESMREAFLTVYSKVIQDKDGNETKIGVFGQKDTSYDYSNTINEITIAELRNNYSNYSTGTKLKLTVRVIRSVGYSLFVEDIEDTTDEDTGITSRAGIFVYHSFRLSVKYAVGTVISFECQASDDETYGQQLVSPSKIRTIEKDTACNITEIAENITDLKEYEGFVVLVKDFTVERIGIENDDTGAYTIYGKMSNESELMIRIDGDANPKMSAASIVVGEKYNIIGGVSKYYDTYSKITYYQIKVGNMTEATFGDFEKIN